MIRSGGVEAIVFGHLRLSLGDLEQGIVALIIATVILQLRSL